MHHCANVVTEEDGVAGAVLLRAAAVEEGLATVASRRGAGIAAAAMLRGPGNLCRGLGITRADDGIDLLDPVSRVHVEGRVDRPPITVSTRVGVRLAAERLLRFTWRGDPAVSSPLPRPSSSDATSRGKRKGPV
jgi:DNA-3-methyladenine glycosylase